MSRRGADERRARRDYSAARGSDVDVVAHLDLVPAAEFHDAAHGVAVVQLRAQLLELVPDVLASAAHRGAGCARATRSEQSCCACSALSDDATRQPVMTLTLSFREVGFSAFERHRGVSTLDQRMNLKAASALRAAFPSSLLPVDDSSRGVPQTGQTPRARVVATASTTATGAPDAAMGASSGSRARSTRATRVARPRASPASHPVRSAIRAPRARTVRAISLSAT